MIGGGKRKRDQSIAIMLANNKCYFRKDFSVVLLPCVCA